MKFKCVFQQKNDIGCRYFCCLINQPTITPDLSLSLQVLVNVAISVIVSYMKVGSIVQLHTNNGDRDTALLLAGVAFQLGSLLGAVLFFLLVYYADIFHYS